PYTPPSSRCPCRPDPPAATYTLSLHDALPISHRGAGDGPRRPGGGGDGKQPAVRGDRAAIRGVRQGGGARDRAARSHYLRIAARSEEHTSELQSPDHLVCRLLLEKKKNKEINR